MPPDPAKVESIFHEAVAMVTPADREAYLAAACGDDAELRHRVDALLAAHDAPGGVLPRPEAMDRTFTGAAPPALSERPGARIGRYKLLEKIGEGGFGVVFVAEQETPVRRVVALKIIKLGMDTRQVIARFEAERQALALMDHPNIAKVLDAGVTETGRPYFVMELVRGLPITQYCDQRHLTPEQRLGLFVDVCHAVQHAHRKGIIHRDLKPSNVIVADYEERPVPKVIDFGVAKAVGQQLTDLTVFTGVGQVVGTLEYMSPEHARLNRLDVDTRSDVYSLGVILYELLTGQTPFDRARLHSAAFDEMLRIIREEEPQRPSLKLSASQALPSIAANRQVEPTKLTKLIHGELDWIVMKALEKDRRRRYDSATALAADLARYLADEPVSAAAPSRAYRARKFVRRNKLLVAASAVLLFGLIAAVVGTTFGMISESRRRVAVERELATAEWTLARSLSSRFQYSEAEAALRRFVANRAGSAAPDDQRMVVSTKISLAQLVAIQGRTDEAEAFAREAVADARRWLAPNDPGLAQAVQYIGLFMRDNRNDYVAAEAHIRELIELNLKILPRNQRMLGNSYLYLADILGWQRRFAEAEAADRAALAEYRKVADSKWIVEEVNMHLAMILVNLDRFGEAEQLLLDVDRPISTLTAQAQYTAFMATLYHLWDLHEPGNGHRAKADEWLAALPKVWFNPRAPTTRPARSPS